jgi:hypothetical protein
MKNCEKCALSLACHAGLLRELSICPLCNTLSINKEWTDIVCHKRIHSKYVKYRWMQYCFNRSRISKYQALNTVLGGADHGPPQYVKDHLPNVLWIQLCRKCIERLMTQSKKQIIREIRRMVYDINGINL